MMHNKYNKTWITSILPFIVGSLLFLTGQTGFAADFQLLFSNDIRGEIEPCG